MTETSNVDEALNLAIENYRVCRPKTEALNAGAKSVMYCGNTRTVLFSAPFLVRIERAEGSQFFDFDGH